MSTPPHPRFAFKMYLHQLYRVLGLLCLTTLPASLSAPTPTAMDPRFTVVCRTSFPVEGHPDWYHIAPFPSHCRALANQLALFPEADTPAPFDERYPDPRAAGRDIIPNPYLVRYMTCGAGYYTPNFPAPGTPNPNLAKFADFAAMAALASRTCFEVPAGEQSKGNVGAFGRFEGLDGSGWTLVLSGHVVQPRSRAGNSTVVLNGSMDEADVGVLRTSLNGSANGIDGRKSKPGAMGSVDVV